jgi:RNA-directed DNA polymerase
VSLATPPKLRRLREALYTKAKQEPAYRFYLLYDKVYRADILAHAYALSKQHGGAPGVDGVTFEDIEGAGTEPWLAAVQEALRTQTYRPQPVRRVLIPKVGGGERPLGIPTIRDRVVQTAALLILQPIFEADMEPTAYGYRPGRTALEAVQEVHRALCAGYTEVIDGDVSQYFDAIPHADLMKSLARRISDRKLLRLLKMWLKAPVAEQAAGGGWRFSGGKRATRGTPQGGVVSPLLSNVYMNRYLKVFRLRGLDVRYGARLVNYADDFVVLCRYGAAEVHAQSRRWFTQMGLTLNEPKTRVCDGRRESFDFQGYTFGPMRYRKDGHWYVGAAPAKKAVKRVKGRIRAILRPGNQGTWDEVRSALNRVVRGWANYFSYGTRLMAYRAVDHYVWERVRHFLRRRHKVPSRGTKRFSADVVFGELGVFQLRRFHLGPPAHARV